MYRKVKKKIKIKITTNCKCRFIGGFTGFETISNVNIFRLNQLALIELNRSFDFALRFYIFFYSTIELQMHNILLLFARYNSYCFTSFKQYCSS